MPGQCLSFSSIHTSSMFHPPFHPPIHPSPVFPAARMRVRLGARARSPRQPKLPPSPCDHRTPLLVTELLDTRARLRSVRALSGPPALPPSLASLFSYAFDFTLEFKIGGLLTCCVLCESNVRCPSDCVEALDREERIRRKLAPNR